MIEKDPVADLDGIAEEVPRLVIPNSVPASGLVGLGEQVSKSIHLGFRLEQPVSHRYVVPRNTLGSKNRHHPFSFGGPTLSAQIPESVARSRGGRDPMKAGRYHTGHEADEEQMIRIGDSDVSDKLHSRPYTHLGSEPKNKPHAALNGATRNATDTQRNGVSVRKEARGTRRRNNSTHTT